VPRSWLEKPGDCGPDRIEVVTSAEATSQARQYFRWLMPCSTRIRSMKWTSRSAPWAVATAAGQEADFSAGWPRRDHRTGGLHAQGLMAGVSVQSDDRMRASYSASLNCLGGARADAFLCRRIAVSWPEPDSLGRAIA
jgi:hypothetical protein